MLQSALRRYPKQRSKADLTRWSFWLLLNAIEWWISLLENTRIDDDIILESLYHICFTMALQSSGGILKGINKTEQEGTIVEMLAFFLIRVSIINRNNISRAWSLISSCLSKISGNEEEKYNYSKNWLFPRKIGIILGKMKLDDSDKVNIIAYISSFLPEKYRYIFDHVIVQMDLKFLKK